MKGSYFQILVWLPCIFLLSVLANAQQAYPANLACSPAPCILPNVQVSEGGMPVNTAVIAANPANSSDVLVSSDDVNCTSTHGVFASSDGGSTWTRTCLLPGLGGAGSPILGYDLNGNAYAGGLETNYLEPSPSAAQVVLSKSTDNGMTWGAPVIVINGVLGYGLRMPWLTVDANPASPRKDSLYVSSVPFDGSFNSQIWVSHSTDGGATWTSVPVDTEQRYFVRDAFNSMIAGADGTVYLSWLRCNSQSFDCGGTTARFMFSKSANGGSTWSVPTAVATVTLTPGLCYQGYGCLPNVASENISNTPSLAVFGSGANARVYAAFYNWTGSQMQVNVATSIDGGSSWGTPVRVSTSNHGDEFFPWITAGSSGKLVVTWLDRRNDPSNVKYQPFVASSNNGGTTFSAAHALSSTLSDPNMDGYHGQYIGDYRTHVMAGKTLYTVWMDTRLGSCQSEVGGVEF